MTTELKDDEISAEQFWLIVAIALCIVGIMFLIGWAMGA